MALDYTIIGKRLKQARIDSGFTQEMLAEKLNVSVAFLSRLETGSSHINLHRLEQICRITGVSEGYILNGVSEEASDYLIDEFAKVLKDCSAEQLKLIYNIAKLIKEGNENHL